MEIQPFMALIQNLGAMGILALMVFKSPSIIKTITDLIQLNVSNVRSAQTEALSVFKDEQDKLLTMFADRFENVEKALQVSIDHQTQIIERVGTLSERVGALERAKSID